MRIYFCKFSSFWLLLEKKIPHISKNDEQTVLLPAGQWRIFWFFHSENKPVKEAAGQTAACSAADEPLLISSRSSARDALLVFLQPFSFRFPLWSLRRRSLWSNGKNNSLSFNCVHRCTEKKAEATHLCVCIKASWVNKQLSYACRPPPTERLEF